MDQLFSVSVAKLKKSFSMYCSDRLQALQLTQGLMFFLIYIGKHPGCSPGELSRALYADAGHTARSVEKLVQLQLLERTRSGTDKRSFALALTANGADAFRQVRGFFGEWDARVLSTLTPEQRSELFFLLDLIFQELDGDALCGNFSAPPSP